MHNGVRPCCHVLLDLYLYYVNRLTDLHTCVILIQLVLFRCTIEVFTESLCLRARFSPRMHSHKLLIDQASTGSVLS